MATRSMRTGKLPDPWIPDAKLDPWALVPVAGDQHVLYGYAVVHPMTGGLSWLRSSPIQQLDLRSRRAVTLSGRRYALGRRVRLDKIPSIGMEAWLAYDLLVGPETEEELVPPISADRDREQVWVSTQKMARHLRVEAPTMDPAEVAAFIKRYLSQYLKQRGSAAPGGFR